jgi:hypothetical protein
MIPRNVLILIIRVIFFFCTMIHDAEMDVEVRHAMKLLVGSGQWEVGRGLPVDLGMASVEW